MPKPTGPLVVSWRDLAAEGLTYAEISRRYPKYTDDQVRHYCTGTAGRKLPGPIQGSRRWQGRNAWLQGDRSPNAELTTEQARAVLDDWDSDNNTWLTPGTVWAKRLGVSPSTIYMMRRGETWEHLNHTNQGRQPKRG